MLFRSDLVSKQLFATFVQGVFLFAGGGSLFAIHNECEVYNPRTDRWSPCAPMGTRRSRAGVTSLGKLVYAIGG